VGKCEELRDGDDDEEFAPAGEEEELCLSLGKPVPKSAADSLSLSAAWRAATMAAIAFGGTLEGVGRRDDEGVEDEEEETAPVRPLVFARLPVFVVPLALVSPPTYAPPAAFALLPVSVFTLPFVFALPFARDDSELEESAASNAAMIVQSANGVIEEEVGRGKDEEDDGVGNDDPWVGGLGRDDENEEEEDDDEDEKVEQDGEDDEEEDDEEEEEEEEDEDEVEEEEEEDEG
jgi:hypothetical protein